MIYPVIGTWYRAYTNALRGPGSSTFIGECVEINRRTVDGQEEKIIHLRNLVGGMKVHVEDLVESLPDPFPLVPGP